MKPARIALVAILACLASAAAAVAPDKRVQAQDRIAASDHALGELDGAVLVADHGITTAIWSPSR